MQQNIRVPGCSREKGARRTFSGPPEMTVFVSRPACWLQRIKLLHTVAAAVASCTMTLLSADAAGAQVDNYPGRPVRLIVPFPPGGAADAMGRLIPAQLSETHGHQLLVDHTHWASAH